MNPSEVGVNRFEFLDKAVSLTSLAVIDVFLGDSIHYEHLYEFIATHKSLTEFTFTVDIYMHWHQFTSVYERILMAMSYNIGLNTLNINCEVSGENPDLPEDLTPFFRRVSEISRILEGRDVFINGAHIDRIIQDLQSDDKTAEAFKALDMTFMLVGAPTISYSDDY